MFTKQARIVIIVLLCVVGGIQFYAGSATGWLYFAAAVLFLLGLRRHGAVWLAYQAAIKGHADRAATLLAEIPDPSHLSRRDLSYYHWVAGAIAAVQARPREAYEHYSAALAGGLRTSHIRAATHCSLAEAALSLGDVALAREHLSKARGFRFRSTLEPVMASLEERVVSSRVPP